MVKYEGKITNVADTRSSTSFQKNWECGHVGDRIHELISNFIWSVYKSFWNEFALKAISLQCWECDA